MRSRSVWLTACSAALAVAVGGCGGNDSERQVAGPKIEGAVANELASLSDEVAQQLEDGDSCAARKTAARLRDGVTEAINGGKVPDVYLEDLSGVVNEIEAQIPECTASPAPPPEDGDKGKGEGKGKKKGHGKDKKTTPEGER